MENKTGLPVWSDDCLSCLCNMPHSMQQHMDAVNKALAELQEQREIMKREHHPYDQDIEDWECNEIITSVTKLPNL